jgi:hypothetical protein
VEKRSRFDCEFQKRAEQKQRESSGRRPYAASARVPVIVRSSTDDHSASAWCGMAWHGNRSAPVWAGRIHVADAASDTGTIGCYRTVASGTSGTSGRGADAFLGRPCSGSTPPLDQGPPYNSQGTGTASHCTVRLRLGHQHAVNVHSTMRLVECCAHDVVHRNCGDLFRSSQARVQQMSLCIIYHQRYCTAYH